MKLFKDLFNARYILSINRMAWIDYARGICIILVCYRHCFDGLRQAGFATGDFPVLQVLNVCFYSFRMPLFFIISGLFVSRSLLKKGLLSYTRSRFSVVFYPLMIWGGLQITLQLIFHNYVNGSPSYRDYLNLIIYPRNPSNSQQFWYLNALFFVGIFYAFFKVVCRFKLWHHAVISLLMYVAGNYLIHIHVKLFLFQDVLHYYLYFFLGDLISGYIFQKKTTDLLLSARWLTLSALLFVVTQSVFTIVNFNHSDDNYISGNMIWLNLLISLSGCLFVVQVCKWLERKNILQWLRIIGYHSLYIYLMHLMVIAAVRVVLVHVLHITYVPVMLTTAIFAGVLVPMVIYNIVTRLGAWWLFSLKKPVGEIQQFRSYLKSA